jgi:hypothetical protein
MHLKASATTTVLATVRLQVLGTTPQYVSTGTRA